MSSLRRFKRSVVRETNVKGVWLDLADKAPPPPPHVLLPSYLSLLPPGGAVDPSATSSLVPPRFCTPSSLQPGTLPPAASSNASSKMGIYPSSLPSLLRTPSLNLLPPTLLQLVLPDTDTPATSEDPYSAHLPQCFVPISIYDGAGGSASVYSGATIKPIHVIIACHHDVASIGGVPINEFTTEGYFSCAFPTLFPTGAGDFSGQHQNQVTIGNYFSI